MNKKELNSLVSIIYNDNINHESTTTLNKIHAQFKAYIDTIELIVECRKGSNNQIRGIITELKQSDGEHWAIGETIERILILLNALDYESGKYIGDKKDE